MGILARLFNKVPLPTRPFFHEGARLKLTYGYQETEHYGGHGGLMPPQIVEITGAPRTEFGGDTWVRCRYQNGTYVNGPYAGKPSYETCWLVNPVEKDWEPAHV